MRGAGEGEVRRGREQRGGRGWRWKREGGHPFCVRLFSQWRFRTGDCSNAEVLVEVRRRIFKLHGPSLKSCLLQPANVRHDFHGAHLARLSAPAL